jgi:superfamily I DNA/RNA helicase
MSTAPPATPPFTAILSTAGSRKTTQLTQLAVAHVLAGHAMPEELLLTTLTRSASAQLHERSVEQFLAAMRAAGGIAADFLDRCHRLEHAAIGTLHSLGLEMLHHAALQTGLPARPKILSAAAEKKLLVDLLDQVDPGLAARLGEHARRLGRHEPRPRMPQGVAFRDDLLDVLELRRRLRLGSRRHLMTACFLGTAHLATTLWPTHPITTSVAEPLDWYLNDLVESHRGAGLTDEQVDKILRQGFWGALGEFKTSSDRNLLLRAAHLHSSHCFHEDCVAYTTTLAEVAHAVAAAYRKEKRRRGVVDYYDLAESLHRHGWPNDVGFIGCDEVQDLTSRQIRTAERLVVTSRHPQAVAVWVGDENQHLFGYQGASWNAANKAIGRLGGSVTPVHTNHRSSPLLVAFFNALFGSKRPHQTAGRTVRAGEVSHVERWILSTRDPQDDQNDAHLRRKLTMPDETRALAGGVADLLQRRPHLKPSDIAVAVRTNIYADHVIQALHELGIPVDASPRSLAETREGRIVVEALRLLADPSDALSAAVIAHLLQDWSSPGDPTAWFWDALQAGTPGHARIVVPGLSELVHDRTLSSRLSPAEAVQRVIAALRLVERVAAWGGAAGRLRNLDGILAVARAYETRCGTEQRPPTIAGLAAVFDAETAEDESPHHARVATGGVTVTTTHSAKGLGWPVTIVGQCDWHPATGSSTFAIRDYEHVGSKGRIRRHPHVLPWPFGTHLAPTKDGSFVRHHVLPHGAKRADLHLGPYGTAAAALPGARALAASDSEAEENNVFVACTRAESILVIAHPPARQMYDPADPEKNYKKKRKIPVPTRLDFLQPNLDRLLPPRAPLETPRPIPGVSAPGSLDYTVFAYSWKSAAAAGPPPGAVVSAAVFAAKIQGFKAVQHSDPYPLEYPPADGTLPPSDGDYPRRYWKPSDEPPTHIRGIDPSACSVEELKMKPLQPGVAARITRANDTLVGDVIHALFAALPSIAGLAPGAREDAIERIAARCIAAGGYDLPLDATDLRDRVLAFEHWLATEGLDLITELPLVVERTAVPATFWRGRIDALGIPRMPGPSSGGNRIIDHKSATGFAPEWLAAWLAETGAYASCLPGATAFEEMVRIHLPLAAALIVARAERS